MPTVESFLTTKMTTLLAFGTGGQGKTTFALQAPGPHAILCIDKPNPGVLPDGFPGYDPKQDFFKSYLPPDTDITTDNPIPSGDVATAVAHDLMQLKNGLLAKQETIKIDNEEWLMPRTIILEGMDFFSDYVEDKILNLADKSDATEFEDHWEPWRRRRRALGNVYKLITFLPSANLCNVVATTGIHEETKQVVNSKGKRESVKTGVVEPDLGGAMDVLGPRGFANSWYFVKVGGKYWAVTTNHGPYEKYRGIRSGRFALQPMENVTIDLAKPVNHWNRLFGV